MKNKDSNDRYFVKPLAANHTMDFSQPALTQKELDRLLKESARKPAKKKVTKGKK